MAHLTETELAARRAAMVEVQLRRRGVLDPNILDVFHDVPRHRFVRPEDINRAYEDAPVEIGFGQTISQPYIVALAMQALELTGDETILEIGTGLGYQAAILSRLAAEVITIEWHEELAEQARENLERLGYDNVNCLSGDGSEGRPEYAPFDAIVVSAAAPRIPPALTNQLDEDGRLIIPVGSLELQELLYCRVRDGQIARRNLTGCRFVPLTGRQGWYDPSRPPN